MIREQRRFRSMVFIEKDLARFELRVICARLMKHLTFDDGGPKVNSSGYKQTGTITFNSEQVF